MDLDKQRYAYIVSNSQQQLWLFHHREEAARFAATRGEGAYLRGDPTTYDVLKVPFSDRARRGRRSEPKCDRGVLTANS